jgi:hypothetical protein
MGTGKKEAQRKIRQGKVGDGMGNVKVKGENFYRYVDVQQFSCKQLTLCLQDRQKSKAAQDRKWRQSDAQRCW